MSLSRREFLRTAAAATVTPGLASAIDPIRRPGPVADLKLSLAAYSYRQFLDVKKGSMTLFDFIDLAAELPLDAVELTYVRPAGMMSVNSCWKLLGCVTSMLLVSTTV